MASTLYGDQNKSTHTVAKLTAVGCPLTSTRLLWHLCTHIHTLKEYIRKEGKVKGSGCLSFTTFTVYVGLHLSQEILLALGDLKGEWTLQEVLTI